MNFDWNDLMTILRALDRQDGTEARDLAEKIRERDTEQPRLSLASIEAAKLAHEIEGRCAYGVVGPYAAYFEFDVGPGEPLQCAYETVRHEADNLLDALNLVREELVAKIAEHAGEVVHVVWRLRDKIQAGYEGGRWKARTRVVFIPTWRYLTQEAPED